MRLAKNSSGKIVATIAMTEYEIIIDNYVKPLLKIFNQPLIQKIKNNDVSGIIELYDDYTLMIGEIASLYNIPYHTMNKKILDIEKQGLLATNKKEGRRNSSFGREFTEERKRHIGDKTIGRHIPPYKRTPEIKERISKTLKKGYKEGRIKVNSEGISQAWADGKFKNAKMGRGIQGFFQGTKNSKDKDVYFRSLLELRFLIMLEENEEVKEYIMEPFSLKINEKSHYTPDCLINNTYLIELKSRDHYKYTNDAKNDRFKKEIEVAQSYCNDNNLEFRVIYDDEIDFETNKFKRYIKNNPDIVEKYNIRFNKELKIR